MPEALYLVAGNTHRNTARPPAFPDFVRTVAEHGQLFSLQVIIADDLLDHHFFRKFGVITKCTVNAAVEQIGVTEHLGLIFNVVGIGTAREVHRHAALFELIDQYAVGVLDPLSFDVRGFGGEAAVGTDRAE